MFRHFYRRYRAECRALGVAPLSLEQLLALIQALIERADSRALGFWLEPTEMG